MYRQILFILLVATYVLQSGAAKPEQQKAAENTAEKDKVNKEQEELERELEEAEEDADEEKDLFEEDDDDAVTEDDAVFFDDDILNNLLQKSKRPPSSNRKCLRFYKGHWQPPPCDGNENQVGIRNEGTEVFCSPCVETESCANNGGICTYSWKCTQNYRRRGCGGKCGCCFPIVN